MNPKIQKQIDDAVFQALDKRFMAIRPMIRGFGKMWREYHLTLRMRKTVYIKALSETEFEFLMIRFEEMIKRLEKDKKNFSTPPEKQPI